MKKKEYLIILVICIVIVLLYFTRGFVIPCMFFEITGLHCSGCGGTRAVISILDKDIYQAFRYNSILFIVVPILVMLYIASKKYKNNDKFKKINKVIIYFLLAITIVYGILRNIPTFHYLAPTILI